MEDQYETIRWDIDAVHDRITRVDEASRSDAAALDKRLLTLGHFCQRYSVLKRDAKAVFYDFAMAAAWLSPVELGGVGKRAFLYEKNVYDAALGDADRKSGYAQA